MEKYNIDEDDGKIVVVSVDVNSEAADKGLVEGDVIKRVGTQQVNSLKEFKKKEKASRKRGSLLLLVKKNDGSLPFCHFKLLNIYYFYDSAMQKQLKFVFS